MCYQNYDDYMRDFFYYNQSSNMNNMGFVPNNMNNYGLIANTNIENLFPNIYRIVMPVIKRVVAGSNYQYLTEEVLNNMVDTVYNIVDGDKASQSENENNINSDNRRNATNNQSIQNQSAVRNDNNSNELLRDLIKILTLQEIIRSGNNRRNMSNRNFYNNQFQNNYYEPINYI